MTSFYLINCFLVRQAQTSRANVIRVGHKVEIDLQLNLTKKTNEWRWTAQNLIARQSIGRHFWQEINCLTQNLSTALIQLILAKPIQANDKNIVKCSNPVLNCCGPFFLINSFTETARIFPGRQWFEKLFNKLSIILSAVLVHDLT